MRAAIRNRKHGRGGNTNARHVYDYDDDYDQRQTKEYNTNHRLNRAATHQVRLAMLAYMWTQQRLCGSMLDAADKAACTRS